jgi:threonine aldolase
MEEAMNTIDLRSDTVTWPTPAMREAMANAIVGDDVYGEDPLVNQLQAEAAELLGKEAGLFVPSGTMANLASILAHCSRGDEFILGKQSHIFTYEAGSASMYGGLQAHTLDVLPDGTLSLDAIRAAIRPSNPHFPITRLICLENSQGGACGAPLPVDYIAQVSEIAHEHRLRLHIDGARLFNAAAALGVSARALAEPADSVSVCLSKGLCAPVGSLIVGSREFIQRAHRIRKSLGGGMRQVGVLAAAGLIALHEMPKRLSEDHANARALAEGLAEMPYVQIDLDRVKTNMIYFSLTAEAPLTVEMLSQRLRDEFNILMRPYPAAPRTIRLVTHYWFKAEHVPVVLSALRELLAPARDRLASD